MTAAALAAIALAFAFPNPQGTHLLATGEVANPGVLRTAICTGGQRVSVEFERRQTEGKDSTGRQAPHNFLQTAGALFRIAGGTVSPNSACVMTDDSFVKGATFVPLQRPDRGARCARSAYPQFQTDKGRPVVACWPIGASVDGVQIAVIEFSRHLTRALASLVVIDGARRMYVDYPATFTGPGDDLWRADDGGNIHPEGFEVVFLMKRGTTYIVAVDWAGAEGNALSLHVSEGGSPFKEAISDSWYRSPM